ncbi:MAG: hypothetical protein WBZ29_09500 [Methanocella sp.]
MRKFWPLLMVLCFGVLDGISTLFVYWQIGTFEYELGLLTNILYDLGSIEAVIVFKLMLTCIAAIMLYYIAESVPRLNNMCKLTCIGASIVGIFAATSNMTGALTGSTLWIFGLRGDMIAYMLFTLFFIAGIADLIMINRRLP